MEAQSGILQSPSAEATSEPPEAPATTLATPVANNIQGAGMGWNTLIHALLEHAARKPDASASELELLAQWLAFSDPELPPLVAEAVKVVGRVIQSPIWHKVLSAGERYVEVPFAVYQGNAVGLATVVEGVIDLVYHTADGWEILDYKTDQVSQSSADALVRRYAGQVLAYQSHWETAISEPVLRCGIYAVRGDQVFWLELDTAK
jgi:ATP-dependent exoDNAse (exonuclease V) beta subunit